MERTTLRLAAVAMAWAGLTLAGCSESSDDSVPDYGVTINAVPGLPSDFMMGGDVSMLAQLEEHGAIFRDEAGKPGDALKIMKDHGMNWVRLRLWNTPAIQHQFDTPEGGSLVTIEQGESAGGANDLARDIALAKRAKALGMKILLDFHYSDWWADPGKQFTPQAWEAYSLEELETSLHDFTRDSLTAMRDAGVLPDMVQIGNELNNGFLWPLGRITGGSNGYDGFAALLSSASDAVREVDPSIRIMVHLANGNDNSLYRSVLSALVARGVDFDVIGLSFYPNWHNTPGRQPMNDLQYNMNDISEYFNRPVVVVEAAYAHTLENADETANAFGAADEAKGGYRATVQGQATYLRDVIATVADVPEGRGLGVFYWAPEWIPVEGAGWKTGEGNNWENMALFDATGRALPSLNVFRAVSQDRPVVIATPAAVQAVEVDTWVGEAPSLPSAVKVTYSDDSVRSMAVLWGEIPAEQYAAAGTFSAGGTIAGVSLPASAQVNVTVNANLLVNPGVEDDEAGWTVDDPSNVIAATSQDVRTGTKTFHWWGASPFNFSVQQTVTGLQAGKTYRFSFWAMGNSGEPMHAWATCGSTTIPLDFTLAGWTSDPSAWIYKSIGGLSGAAGSCTVGVSSAGRAEDWGSLDDFSFVEQ